MQWVNRISLFLLTFSLNFDAWSIFSDAAFSVPKLIALVYFALVVITYGSVFRQPSFSKPLLYISATLVVIALGSLTFGIATRFSNLISFGLNIVLLATLLKHFSGDIKAPFWGLLGISFGVCLCYLLLWLGIGRSISIDKRVTFFGDNENLLGIRACVASIIFLIFALEDRSRYKFVRPLFLVGAAISAKLLIDTGSRVSFVALFSSSVLGIMLFQSRSFILKLGIVSTAAVVGYSLFSMLTTTNLYDRLERSFRKGDLAGRDRIWSEIFPLFYENPVYGIGYSGLEEFLGRDTSPHNVIIEVLVLGGVFGIVFYLLYLYQLLWCAVRAIKREKDILPLLLLVPMAGAILSGQTLDVKLFYFIPAVVLYAGISAEIRNNSKMQYSQITGASMLVQKRYLGSNRFGTRL